jgi:hypothetical protein
MISASLERAYARARDIIRPAAERLDVAEAECLDVAEEVERLRLLGGQSRFVFSC